MRSSTSGGAGLRAHGATRAISPRVELELARHAQHHRWRLPPRRRRAGRARGHPRHLPPRRAGRALPSLSGRGGRQQHHRQEPLSRGQPAARTPSARRAQDQRRRQRRAAGWVCKARHAAALGAAASSRAGGEGRVCGVSPLSAGYCGLPSQFSCMYGTPPSTRFRAMARGKSRSARRRQDWKGESISTPDLGHSRGREIQPVIHCLGGSHRVSCETRLAKHVAPSLLCYARRPRGTVEHTRLVWGAMSSRALARTTLKYSASSTERPSRTSRRCGRWPRGSVEKPQLVLVERLARALASFAH